jgi:hypothetical protein
MRKKQRTKLFISFLLTTLFLIPQHTEAKKEKRPAIEFTYDPAEPPKESVISSGMSSSDQKKIEETIKMILPGKEKQAEERALSFITKDMDAEEKSSVLLTVSLIEDKYWPEFEKYTKRLLKGDIDGTGIALVVSTAKKVQGKIRKHVLKHADLLIQPTMSGTSRSTIIKAIAEISNEKEQSARVKRAKRHIEADFPKGNGHGYTKRIKELLKTPINQKISKLK